MSNKKRINGKPTHDSEQGCSIGGYLIKSYRIEALQWYHEILNHYFKSEVYTPSGQGQYFT